jgi:hypothetical protein
LESIQERLGIFQGGEVVKNPSDKKPPSIGSNPIVLIKRSLNRGPFLISRITINSSHINGVSVEE